MSKKFIIEPNLPKNRVKTVLLGEKYASFLGKKFEKLGISIIGVPENTLISPQVSAHADMSVCYMGAGVIIAADTVFDKLRQALPEKAVLIKGGSAQSAQYPNDIGLNACIIGDRLLHNLKYTDMSVIKYAKLNRFRSYNVNQGYTKCSVCVLNRGRIITGDSGIHRVAEALGIESLLIRNGSIALEGYDTGFIGGCCGKIAENKIAFTGRLSKHPDEKSIVRFIEGAGIEIVYLTDEPLFDVGSIIPLEEYSA